MTTEQIVRWVIENFEGQFYTDDPFDRGGATKFGITQNTLAYWRRTKLGLVNTTKLDVQALTLDLAVRIGVEVFAQERKIDLLTHWRTKLVTYDYAFHSGTQAIKDLQRVLGVSSDGVIGPNTLAAEAASAELITSLKLLTLREKFMQSIVQRNQTQRKYLLGWWNRTTTLQNMLTEGIPV